MQGQEMTKELLEQQKQTFAPWMVQLKQTLPEDQYDLVDRVLEFAACAHHGQFRKSGEPYITHPCAVAKILIDYGMDYETIAAALLHDVVEDTEMSREDITQRFGAVVAHLVDGVTKLDKINMVSRQERQAESLRKMLMAMVKDVRVIIIKLADRLHNMRTLYALNEEKRRRIAQETLDIYAPIAHRLGIYAIRSELEDLALKYLEPEKYEYIVSEVAKLRPRQADFLQKQMDFFKTQLTEMGIECEIEGREKHVYSIYKKMVNQGREPNEIYDLMAMRIIVNTVRDCYAALGMVHTLYKPIPGRFKDFIAMPKSNMYQSLHTTVINSAGILFEVQIRTFEMHRTAEYGVAAHWKYKEGKEDKDFDEKIAWFRDLKNIKDDEPDPEETIDVTRLDMFTDEVFVFTPKGEVITLKRGSTPIDFAYRIHSRVGDTCVGAKVNGRIVPLDTELNTGDVVQIQTRKDGHPSRDWLLIAKTNNAKNRIRGWFKREMKDENIAKGKEMLEKEAKRQGFDLYKDLFISEWLEPIFKRYTFHELDDLYAAVGCGGVSTNQILQRLIEECQKKHKQERKAELLEKAKQAAHRANQSARTPSHGVIVKGQENMLVRMAHCCRPVPGDPIVGFITRGRGVSIHRADCSNLLSLIDQGDDRIIEVAWAEESPEGYRACLSVITLDKTGVMAEMTQILSSMGVPITSVQGHRGKNKVFHTEFEIMIQDIDQLERIIKQFQKMPYVIEAYRGTM